MAPLEKSGAFSLIVLTDPIEAIGRNDEQILRLSEFLPLGQFYEQVTGIKPCLIVISPFVEERAADLARLWDITIYEEPEDVPTEGNGESEQ